MLKTLLFAPLAALLFVASPARAGELRTLTLAPPQAAPDRGLRAELVEVSTRRNPAAVIATDALYGGIAGLAVGAGVALINGGDNWGRSLGVGAGVGLLAGALFGAIDVASSSDRAYAVGESRDRGFGSAYRLGGRY